MPPACPGLANSSLSGQYDSGRCRTVTTTRRPKQKLRYDQHRTVVRPADGTQIVPRISDNGNRPVDFFEAVQCRFSATAWSWPGSATCLFWIVNVALHCGRGCEAPG